MIIMDELPTIKKLSKIQESVREALKNAPPLQLSKPSKSDFIIFETNTSSDNIFHRLLTHNNINSSQHLNIDNKSPKRKCNQIHKWSQLKNQMMIELENKRMEFWKNKQINDKLENEECLELEDYEENEEELNDNDNEKENNSKDMNTTEDNDVENESVSDESEDHSEEDMSESDDSNPFIDNEAQEEKEDNDEEEEEDECVEEEKELNDCHHIKAVNKQTNDEFDERLNIADENKIEDNVSGNEVKEESFIETEKCNDLLDESLLNTSINSLNESFTKKFATQNIALSPFNTQPKFRTIYNNQVSQLLKTNESNSQLIQTELLDLCSGEFSSNVPKIIQEEEEEEVDQENDYELLNGKRRIDQAFNVDSDSDESDNESDLKPFDDSQKEHENVNNNESDSEELIVTETEVSDDEYISEEEEQDIKKIGNGFIEDEAELSGSEASSDEEDNEDDYEDLNDFEDKEELPSDSELKDQIERFHNKNVLDEDKRQLLIMKEMYLEDGDLHEDGKMRQKKFRWNFDGNSDYKNEYLNQDSEEDYGSEDDQNFKTPALRMFEDETDSTTNVDCEESKNSKFKLNLNVKGVNSLASFVVRDERLKSIISKRGHNSKSKSINPMKKFKGSKKNNKTSIFDLF